MRVLICAFGFAGQRGASGVTVHTGDSGDRAAAEAAARGWLGHSRQDEVVVRVLSNGGSGALEALTGRFVEVPAGERDSNSVWWPGPQGFLLDEHGDAWIEIPDRERSATVGRSPDGFSTASTARAAAAPIVDSRPIGEFLRAAAARRPTRIVVTASERGPASDAGAGLLTALGGVLHPIDRSPTWDLGALTSVDLDPARRVLDGIGLALATDCEAPATGPRGVAAMTPGLSASEVQRLEVAVDHWCALLGRRSDGRRPCVALGAAAGGGIGAALLALGATRLPATPMLQQGVVAEVGQCDVMILVTPALDIEMLDRGPVRHVLRAALDRATPAVVLAPTLTISRRQWIQHGVSGAYEVQGQAHGVEGQGDPRRDLPPLGEIAVTAARIAATWSHAIV